MTFDGNSSLPFKVHIIESLGNQISIRHGMGGLEQTIRQGALAVINMGDDAEISNSLHEVQIYIKSNPAATLQVRKSS